MRKGLYPEVEGAGGLPQALQFELDKHSTELCANGWDEQKPSLAFANVEHGIRHSQLLIAAEKRAFLVDFWHDHIQYGTGSVESLDVVASAITRFVHGMANIDAMGREFPWFNATTSGVHHERGDLTEYIWQEYLAKRKDALPHPDLGALIKEAASQPELRPLVVYTSLSLLCLTKEHYPGGKAVVLAEPLGRGRFKVSSAQAAIDESHLLGEGDARYCAGIMAEFVAEK